MTDARSQTAAPADTGDRAGRFHRTLGFAARHGGEYDPDVWHRPVHHDPADRGGDGRTAGGTGLDRGRDPGPGRRPGLGGARGVDARLGRDLPVPAQGLPVPHWQPHAVPVHLDRDAVHPAHVHRRDRTGELPGLLRPAPVGVAGSPDRPGRHRPGRRGPVPADRASQGAHHRAVGSDGAGGRPDHRRRLQRVPPVTYPHGAFSGGGAFFAGSAPGCSSRSATTSATTPPHIWATN